MLKRTRVELPAAVRRPFEVFVNGVPQVEGTDFEVVGSTLLFERELAREQKLAPWRWLLLFLGVWSSYRHFDTIDVIHTVDGRRTVATLAPVDADGPVGASGGGRYPEG